MFNLSIFLDLWSLGTELSTNTSRMGKRNSKQLTVHAVDPEYMYLMHSAYAQDYVQYRDGK
jgi:hypothetical protein